MWSIRLGRQREQLLLESRAGFIGGFRLPERPTSLEQTLPSCSKRVATGNSNSGHVSIALCDRGGVAGRQTSRCFGTVGERPSHGLSFTRRLQGTRRRPPSAVRRSPRNRSAHFIRHTTATQLLRAGVDINTIRAWLDRVSIDTTNVYAEVDRAAKAQMLSAGGSLTAGNVSTRRWRTVRP